MYETLRMYIYLFIYYSILGCNYKIMAVMNEFLSFPSAHIFWVIHRHQFCGPLQYEFVLHITLPIMSAIIAKSFAYTKRFSSSFQSFISTYKKHRHTCDRQCVVLPRSLPAICQTLWIVRCVQSKTNYLKKLEFCVYFHKIAHL